MMPQYLVDHAFASLCINPLPAFEGYDGSTAASRRFTAFLRRMIAASYQIESGRIGDPQ